MSPAGQHAATDIAIDTVNGLIYVCGYSTIGADGEESGTNLNYVGIKFNASLVEQWSGLTSGTHQKARIYQGPAPNNGEDIAVSIACDNVGVFVTGNSYGGSTNLTDIVTLYLDAATGDTSTLWPSGGSYEARGVRRFHGGHGHDTAAEVGFEYVMDGEDVAYTKVYVGGTSYRGSANLNDIQGLSYGDEGQLATYGSWASNYDSGNNDVGTGISVLPAEGSGAGLYVCGHSEMGGGEAPTNIDYRVVRFEEHEGQIGLNLSYDFRGGDYCVDMVINSSPQHTHVWLTGRAHTGATFDAGTVVFDANTGDMLGQETWRYVTGGDYQPTAIIDAGGGVCITGAGIFSPANYDTFTILYNLSLDPTTLTREWVMRAPGSGGTGYDGGLGLAADGGGNVFVCGESDAGSTYGRDFLTMRIDR